MQNPEINMDQKPSETPKQTDNQAPTQSKTKGIVREVITFILIAVCIVLPFRIYIAEPYLVDGRSMDPTFETGDYLIVDKLSYRLREPERNTVVVFHYPNNPGKSFIKRIIGLPGETVVGNGDDVTIINTENPDGFKIDQSYVTHKQPSTFKVTLLDDEYFVMGDNRAESFDSRAWGPLNRKFISGKPVLRLLPISQIGLVPGQNN
ncbi:MAG: signal peptidase I [Minisyncoccia bacterium]